jgi:hypothetical protein
LSRQGADFHFYSKKSELPLFLWRIFEIWVTEKLGHDGNLILNRAILAHYVTLFSYVTDD